MRNEDIRSKKFTVYLNAHEHKALQRAAASEGMDASPWVRRLLLFVVSDLLDEQEALAEKVRQ